MADLLMIAPGREIGETCAVLSIQTDETGLGDLLGGGHDVLPADSRLVTEHLHTELLGVGHETALVIGLGEHADPETEGAIGETTYFAVLQRFGLQRANP